MLDLLGGDPEFTEPSSYPLPDRLSRLLDEGFEQKNGLTFLRSLVVSSSPSLKHLKETEDETGIETFVNEIHIEDSVESTPPVFELARLGCDFAFTLACRLHEFKPQTGFRVIASVMAASDSGSARDTCVVRFHERRNHQSWLCDDLESYREEAIEVLDV